MPVARTYKRDSNGRFAGGGGSSGGRGGSKPAAKPKPAAKAKPKSTTGGRKRNKSSVTTTGTFATRIKARLAQKERTKQFSSKAAPTAAKLAWKKAQGEARKGAKGGKSLEERKLDNAVRRGVRRRTTELDQRLRRQYLAAAQQKLANLIANPPRNSLYGSAWGKMQIEQQRRHVESLMEPMPSTRRVDVGAIMEAAKKRQLAKRQEKRNRKFARSLETATRAGAWYRQTGTLPASMRKKKPRRKRS